MDFIIVGFTGSYAAVRVGNLVATGYGSNGFVAAAFFRGAINLVASAPLTFFHCTFTFVREEAVVAFGVVSCVCTSEATVVSAVSAA